jgi:hypothetical protein
MSQLRWAIALACATSLLAACGEGSAPSPTSYIAPTPAAAATRSPLPAPAVIANALVPPAGSVYFGAYVDTSGLLGGATPADTLQFEASLGRTLALHMEYQSWQVIFDGPSLQADFNDYLIPVVSWNCGVADSKIAIGAYDSTITLKAQEIKAYGWPVFLRFFWDPNLPSSMMNRSDCYNTQDNPDGTFSGPLYIKAWDHIRQIFAQVGATNVVWVWTYSTNPNAVSPAAYYPGPSEVDWVGVDDYDLNDASFQSTFSGAYSTLTPYGKPIMISETGADSATQSSFFSAAASTLQSSFPQVQAFLYYDGIDYVTGENQDWRVTSAAFPQFTTFANASNMAATYGQ